MSDDKTVLVERTEDVVTVTMNRPDALNAITPGMLGELNDAFEALEGDGELRAVVLTGAGRAFSAGVDLKALGERKLTGGMVGAILDVPARQLTERISALPVPVIAKVNGHCFTGALELALACDLFVAADEALIGDTHAKFGLRPTWGMSQRLPQAVGLVRARELSMTARMFRGTEAVEMGMAARSAPRDELDDVVAGYVEAIVSNSRDSHAAYKDLYRVAESASLADGLAYEAATTYEIADTEERIADFRS